jgi:hypothetical protein
VLVKDIESGVAAFEKSFITSPEKAARIILRAVQKNQRRVLVGPDAVFLDLLVRLLPSDYQRLNMAYVRRSMR